MEDENLDENLNEETTSQDTADDVTSNDESTGEDEIAALKAKLEELEEKNKQLFARAKKPKPKAQPTNNSTQPDVKDISKFYASGGTDEEFEVAETIMKGKEITFSEALKDPLLVTYREGMETKKKAEKAQLGASNGSPGEKKVDTSKMTEEEHQKYFREVIQSKMNG